MTSLVWTTYDEFFLPLWRGLIHRDLRSTWWPEVNTVTWGQHGDLRSTRWLDLFHRDWRWRKWPDLTLWPVFTVTWGDLWPEMIRDLIWPVIWNNRFYKKTSFANNSGFSRISQLLDVWSNWFKPPIDPKFSGRSEWNEANKYHLVICLCYSMLYVQFLFSGVWDFQELVVLPRRQGCWKCLSGRYACV